MTLTEVWGILSTGGTSTLFLTCLIVWAGMTGKFVWMREFTESNARWREQLEDMQADRDHYRRLYDAERRKRV